MRLTRDEAIDLVVEQRHGSPDGCRWSVTEVTDYAWGWAFRLEPDLVLFGSSLPVDLVDASDGVVLSAYGYIRPGPGDIASALTTAVTRYEAGEWPWEDLAWARLRAGRRFERSQDVSDNLLRLLDADGVDNRIRLENECLALLLDQEDTDLVAAAAECGAELARRNAALRKPTEVFSALRSWEADAAAGSACTNAIAAIERCASQLPQSEITWQSWVAEARSQPKAASRWWRR